MKHRPAPSHVKVCIGFIGLAGESRPPMIYESAVTVVPFGPLEAPPPPRATESADPVTPYGFHKGPYWVPMRAKEDWVVVAWVRRWFSAADFSLGKREAKRLGLSSRTRAQLHRIEGGRIFYPQPGGGYHGPTSQSETALCAVYCHRREAEALLGLMQRRLLSRFEELTRDVTELAARLQTGQVHPGAMVTSARRLDSLAAARVDLSWQIAMLGQSECKTSLDWLQEHSLAMMTLNNVSMATRHSP